MEPSFIFIGHTHSFLDDFIKEKEIIESANPEFVLSEQLENLTLDSKEKYLEILEKRKISNMTSFKEIEKLIKLCFNKNIKLIGIDFPNFGFDINLQEKIKNKKSLTEIEEEKLKKIIKEREKNHFSKILEYNKKTNLPLVIILGCWHLRKGSFLREKLDNYKIIAPLDEKGEVIFEPKEGKEIKYGEITSNGSENKA